MVTLKGMDLSAWYLFFYFAAAQGLFLALVLFATKSPDRKNMLLGLVILLYSIALTDNVCFWLKCYESNPHLLGVSMAFPMIYGPLFFLYFREALKSGQLSWRDWVHFVLPGLLLLYLSPYYLSSAPEKLEQIKSWHQNPVHVLIVPPAQTLSLLGYSLLILRLMKSYEASSDLKILEFRNWLTQIFGAFLLFNTTFLSYQVLVYTGLGSINSDHMVALVSALTIYFIGYLGFSKSKLLNGIKVKEVKYASTTLTETASSQLFAQVCDFVASSKVYTDSSLRLPALAERLSITPHQLSQVINEQAQRNFSEFINAYRIEEAKRRILDTTHINRLAMDVGFNNKTSFNQAFKKFVGCSPSAYREKLEAARQS